MAVSQTLARADRRPPWAAVALLVVIGSAVMVNSSSVVDTARDVYYAWQIASGSSFPLEGPHLGAVVHGSPVWFYLLAVPLVFTPNWVVLSLWVGLLTSLKYALAWACGSRLGDRNLGLAWAALLALPDWSSLNYLIFSHTNLVETAVLLSFYCLIRWQQGDQRWFYGMCLALGLGIHAHPTVYAAGVVALPFVVLALWRRQLGWGRLAVGALVAVAPLLPYVISQALQQWPDLQTGKGYFASQPLSHNLAGFFDVLVGAFVDGPAVALRYVLGLHGAALWLGYAVLAGVLGGGLALALFAMLRSRRSGLGMQLLLATLVFVAAVALIRNVTPFYMTLAIYPAYYGLIAWGWWRASGRRGVFASRLLAGCALLSLAGFAAATLGMGRSGHLVLPPRPLMDVRTHALNEQHDVIYYPAWGRGRLGEFICSRKQPLYLHGFASLILEQSYALEARMRCAADRIYLGGQGEGEHYIGVSRRDAGRIGIGPGETMGSMQVYEAEQIVAPAATIPVPAGDVYPPRPYYDAGESRSVTFEFRTGTGEILAITNLYHFWMPYSFSATLNGEPAEPSVQNTFDAYFACGVCAPGEVQNWSVTITAPRPEFVEVVTFRPPIVDKP